jgi:2-iminobutanoate/2-iminopropanoate deaminase
VSELEIDRYITTPADGSPPLYASAVTFNGVVYTTQIPELPDGSVELGSMRRQCEQLFSNLADQLSAAGSDMSRLLHMTIYLTDMSDRPVFNEVYKERVPQPVPVRCAVEVSALAIEGMKVEITVLAAVN